MRIGLMADLFFSQYALHEFGVEPLLPGLHLATEDCEEFVGCPLVLVTQFIGNVELTVPQSVRGYDLWIDLLCAV